MNPIYNMYSYLYKKPQVGIATGVASGVAMKVQHFLTNEAYLKIATTLGAYGSVIITMVAVTIQLIKLYDILKPRIVRVYIIVKPYFKSKK